MDNGYAGAVRFIFGFTDYEFTPLSAATASALQLSRLRSLLERLGNPQRAGHSVHITGSKGKGSTARMIAALLEQTGARVGLYTSPHLHSPRERIAIDGAPISEEVFTRLVMELRSHVEAENRLHPDSCLTTFELLTALAFLAFREAACEWQVIEVGLGGRLDATNVLDEKALCVFTPISLEHTAILGPTTAAIATDKAGILRPGCRAVLAPQDDAAGAVLRQACATLDVPFEAVDVACSWEGKPEGLDGQDCRVRTPRTEYEFWLPLLGGYQVENAATALLAIENLAGEGVALTHEQVGAGFGSVRWPGRLEVLSRTPLVFADGAHNAASAQRLAEALGDLCGGRRVSFVIGTLADKDLAGMVAALAPLAQAVIAVEADHPRARPAVEIAAAFEEAGVTAGIGGGVAAGLASVMERRDGDAAICVAGSLYVVAEARAALLDVEG